MTGTSFGNYQHAFQALHITRERRAHQVVDMLHRRLNIGAVKSSFSARSSVWIIG